MTKTLCDHWGLKAPPFDNLPDPRFYFSSGQHEHARQRLLYGIQAMKGLVLLTGEIGCGKTLTSRALIQSLSEEEYDVAVIANPALPPNEFLVEVLYQFGLESSGDKVERLHRLNEHLLANLERRISTVLMVDEAQSVPDDATYEDLRLLLNFQLNDRFLLTLVLFGQPELQERIAAIPQLEQRVAVRYHLRPFDAEETTAYIRARLRAAGGNPDLFTKEAVHEIFVLSGGICRVINTFCDLSLFLGAEEKLQEISPSVVRQARHIA